jgi:predicted RNase H-like HicB family nuclease
VFEKGETYYIGYCPEVPGANGQGETFEECRESLKEAIKLVLEGRLEDGLCDNGTDFGAQLPPGVSTPG